MKKNNKKGFTIVELVIVIAVIGILSAILIPTFVGVTKAANEAALRSNLANAYSMYVADAADGTQDGTTGDNVVYFPAIVSQEDVYLKNATNEVFEFDGKEWKKAATQPEASAQFHIAYKGTATTTGFAVTYGEYQVLSKEQVTNLPALA